VKLFKIIKVAEKRPVRLPIKPGIKVYPGYVMMTAQYDNNLVLDISDGKGIFGIAGKKCIGGSNFSYQNVLEVWVQKMVFQTDKFDKTYEILKGSLLYVNNKGLLTSNKSNENIVSVGEVIVPLQNNKKYIEVHWL
jgi:hypothetical protein